jgi:hypothetical protein
MTPRLWSTLAVVWSLLLVPVAVPAVTIEDCQLWLGQLRGEAGSAQIGGEEAADTRRELLKQIDDASPRKQATPSESAKGISKFQKRARQLAADGKVSATEGERLQTLSDTVRHCLEQVEAEQEEE